MSALEDLLGISKHPGQVHRPESRLHPLIPKGAREAPPPVIPPQPTGAVGTTDPLVALQHAYAAWMQRTGRQQDPLAAQVGQKSFPGLAGPLANDPIRMLSTGREITHGANAGQTAQTYDLGNGKTANVYYDPNGRRRVNVY